MNFIHGRILEINFYHDTPNLVIKVTEGDVKNWMASVPCVVIVSQVYEEPNKQKG